MTRIRLHPRLRGLFACTTLLLSLLVVGCDDAPAGSPDLGGPACEPNGNFCMSHQTCVRSDGFCRGPGLCTDRPTTCVTGGPMVVGCDGMTYTNECEAYRAGTSVDTVLTP